MSSSVQLLSSGIIEPDLHYGIHAKDWWWQTSKKVNKSNVNFYHPICIGMKTQFFLNGKKYTLRVIRGYKNNEFCPGYCCQCEELSSEVEKNPTDAVSKLYQKINVNSTRRISGAEVLGFESNEIVQELLLNVEFRPYSIQIENINLFICGLGCSNNDELCGAGNGYVSIFNHTQKKKHCTFFQKIVDNKFIVEIWYENNLLKKIEKERPNDAWSEVGILAKLKGKEIAGLDNDITKTILGELKALTCTSEKWEDEELMQKIFNHYLKKKTIANVDWCDFFNKWNKQDSTMIELYSSLEKIYPLNHKFSDRELQAWNAMLRAVGCTNITPFSNKISPVSSNDHFHLTSILINIQIIIFHFSIDFGLELLILSLTKIISTSYINLVF